MFNCHTVTEMVPQTNNADYNRILPSFLSIWNDPENNKYLSFTLQPFLADQAGFWFSNHLDAGVRYFAVSGESGETLGISVIKINRVEGFEIFGLGVRPEVKRRCVGSSLIAHAIDLARELGFKAVDAGVFADNFKMISLLTRHEFMAVNIRHRVRADGADIVYMRKYLGELAETA